MPRPNRSVAGLCIAVIVLAAFLPGICLARLRVVRAAMGPAPGRSHLSLLTAPSHPATNSRFRFSPSSPHAPLRHVPSRNGTSPDFSIAPATGLSDGSRSHLASHDARIAARPDGVTSERARVDALHRGTCEDRTRFEWRVARTVRAGSTTSAVFRARRFASISAAMNRRWPRSQRSRAACRDAVRPGDPPAAAGRFTPALARGNRVPRCALPCSRWRVRRPAACSGSVPSTNRSSRRWRSTTDTSSRC